ncbi:MAG: ATP-binding protein, partial [Ktedonobacteraceae bacterium]
GKYQLVCNLDAELLPVWADADRLRQVLLNVVENAIKYSPQGGRIELEARGTETRGGQDNLAQVCITIRDQGMGIPRQHMARVFQPFERLERPATSHIPGVGLGLYIARYLVEAMAGTLDIQSCEGSGTDVIIRLSLAEMQAQVPSLLA